MPDRFQNNKQIKNQIRSMEYRSFILMGPQNVVNKFILTNNFSQAVFPFSALTLMVWRQEGHPACKTL